MSRGKNDPSQSLQMIGHPLMTPDELKSIPKGHFIVMKTGTHPMRSELRLFLKWGITLEQPFELPEKAVRPIRYADKEALEQAIEQKYPAQKRPTLPPRRPVPIRLGGEEDVLL